MGESAYSSSPSLISRGCHPPLTQNEPPNATEIHIMGVAMQSNSANMRHILARFQEKWYYAVS